MRAEIVRMMLVVREFIMWKFAMVAIWTGVSEGYREGVSTAVKEVRLEKRRGRRNILTVTRKLVRITIPIMMYHDQMGRKAAIRARETDL